MGNDNNRRIIKNTGMLYIRMLLIMVVTLYTSRVVLKILGVEDYGIYNVVGGIVVMFSFLNSSMSSAVQRFLSFEIGKGDYKQFQKVFSQAISIHIFIAILIVILAETIGLWFLNTQMNIPLFRMSAAQWVYQFSILTFVMSVIQVPYNASIISHEKMSMYAYVSIIEVILRLLIVFVLVWTRIDKLKLYAVLMFAVTCLVTWIYQFYCKRKLKGCHYVFCWDKKLFGKLINFSGWNLFGNISWVTLGQGLNILLNIFFGPVVNTARAISFQVNSAVSVFVSNFRLAVNPQVVKSYASNNHIYMKKLVFESAKYSYYLLFLLSLPVLLETHIILKLWLGMVPEYTVLFTQLILISTLIQSFDASFAIIFQAVGKIKENQFASGLIYLLVLPASYLFFKLGYSSPALVFYLQIAATFLVSFVVKIYLLNSIIHIPYSEYFKLLFWPVSKVTCCALIIPLVFRYYYPATFLRFIMVIVLSGISVLFSIYYIGLTQGMRSEVKNYIHKFNFKFLKEND